MTDKDDHISDQEIIDQIADRLQAAGVKAIFIDKAVVGFAKVAAYVLGGFVLVGVVFFSFDVNNAATEVRELRDDIATARNELNAGRAAFEEDARVLKTAQEDALASVADVREATRSTLRTAALTLAEFVAKNAVDDPELHPELKQFYLDNLDLATERDLPLLRSEILRKLGFFYWQLAKDPDTGRDYYEQAVRVALAYDEDNPGDGGKRLAAEIIFEHASNENTSISRNARLTAALAKRLLVDALALFEDLGDQLSQANTLRILAQVLRNSGQTQSEEYLDVLERARVLFAQAKATDSQSIGSELALLRELATHYASGQTDEGRQRALNLYAEVVTIARRVNRATVARNALFEMAKLEPDSEQKLEILCSAFEYNRDSVPPMSDEKITRFVEKSIMPLDGELQCAGD